MKNMTLANIAVACNGTYFGSDTLKEMTISGVAIDSRLIKKDFLFIPIVGDRVDGHTFIPQVMEAGALCTLSEQPLEGVTHPYILVESSTEALKDLAKFYRESLDITVIGITGSVGKTSTKEMVASVLSQKYNVLKTAGNHNNLIGLPLTIFEATEEHEVAVLEMGINQFGEMTELSRVATPDIAVITNIGLCHLEFLQNREGVLRAKSEIFTHMSPNSTVLLNGEDMFLANIKDVPVETTHYFGLQDTHDTYADNVVNQGLEGTSCTIHLANGDTLEPTIPIPGSHMVLNALVGASVAHTLGLTPDEIKAGIEALEPVDGRNSITKTDKFTIIDDCYNANPVSMNASLNVLANALGRKVAILGDMGELGDNEEELHYGVGIHAAYNHIDLICCIGPLSYQTYGGALKTILRDTDLAHCHPYYFETKEDFLDAADHLLIEGDTILVKASNFMKFKELVTTLNEM